MLALAIITISLALVAYSFGVISEARRKNLFWRDVAWFGVGLVFDTTGTILMSVMSNNGDKVLAPWASSLMSITGSLAIALMAIHILAAVYVLKVRPQARKMFHPVSVAIYVIWLISYLVGMLGVMWG
ncbi:TIGR03987 family protein [Boudabousia tangfeifanii]|uniref:TIGR03987 family protein n=1 Tax=Boudabousia tangfeifanii TaxID=1912795 RepID=A0A1D9MIJ8_9ACTO|nr:HsmA family protein [Boudabousia tangfeifanii]AOZ72161.1 TIGR03987 family protein [Boudabousia tangfeifanii]